MGKIYHTKRTSLTNKLFSKLWNKMGLYVLLLHVYMYQHGLFVFAEIS